MSQIQREEGDYFHLNFLQLPKQKEAIMNLRCGAQNSNSRNEVDERKTKDDNEYIKMISIIKREKNSIKY